MMRQEPLHQAATIILKNAIRIAPPDIREWGQAMQGELAYVERPWAALMWAVGGAWVLAKQALAALLIPSRRGQGVVPDGDIFARSVSLRKAALAGSAACLLGALVSPPAVLRRARWHRRVWGHPHYSEPS